MRRPLAIAGILAVALAATWLIRAAGDDQPTDEEVIREWVDTLRQGDVEAAGELFALPAVVANGTPPVALETRRDAVAFNRSLPCGARLIDTESAEGGTIGTFELTERPGGDCGAGVGELARTLFVIRDGQIAEWHRLDDPIDTGETV